jgi:hypothetical protein
VLRLPVRLTPAGPRATRLVAIAAVLQLLAGTGAALLVDVPERASSTATATRARVAPPGAPVQGQQAQTEREAAVRQLLAQRASALLRRDEGAFLAVVDPAATELRERQQALFDALAEVPLKIWRYRLDARVERPADAVLDRKYGRDRWWAPDVALEHAIEGYDERATVAEHHLTFVKRDGRWLLGADDDFEAVGLATPRALWDRGPVAAERVDDVLVLGRPSARRLLRNVAALTAAAVPRVDAVWGKDWRRGAVVVVPTSGAEMGELLAQRVTSRRSPRSRRRARRGAATSSTRPATGSWSTRTPSPGSGQLGRRVVLTHELTHVATRRATGPAGAGVAGGGVRGLHRLPRCRPAAGPVGARAPQGRPRRQAACGASDRRRLRREQCRSGAGLRAGMARRPAARGRRTGRRRCSASTVRSGARRGGVQAADAVDEALREELGTTTAALTRDWRASLQRDLG